MADVENDQKTLVQTVLEKFGSTDGHRFFYALRARASGGYDFGYMIIPKGDVC